MGCLELQRGQVRKWKKETKNIRKRGGLRRLVSIESHVQKWKRDNRIVYG